MKQFRKLVTYVNKAYLWASMGFLFILIVACVLQVFTRTVMNASMLGTEEAARYAFIWASLLGASLCVSNRSNAAVDMLNNSMKGKLKHVHLIVIHLIMIIFSVIMIINGGRMISFVAKQLSPTLRLSMKYIYLACPVGAIGILLNCLSVITEEIEALKGGEEPCNT